jgi:hypothetical protein
VRAYADATWEARRPRAARRADDIGTPGLLRLQRTAGNSAVVSLLTVQRDDTAAPTGGPPPVVRIDARQVAPDQAGTATPTAGTDSASPAGATTGGPTTGGGGAAPTAAGTSASTGGAAPSTDGTTTTQWQLQTNYQGQRQYLLGHRAQDSMAQQVAVQLNVQHHPDGAAGREETYTVQGSWDPVTRTMTGAQGQAQVALVTATMHGLQGQLFAQVSGGAAFDAAGSHGSIGAAGGAQINYNITKDTQVFLNGQVGYNATQGQGSGPNYAVGAGVTWTIPGS